MGQLLWLGSCRAGSGCGSPGLPPKIIFGFSQPSEVCAGGLKAHTKIEVWQVGAWVDLESLALSADLIHPANEEDEAKGFHDAAVGIASNILSKTPVGSLHDLLEAAYGTGKWSSVGAQLAGRAVPSLAVQIANAAGSLPEADGWRSRLRAGSDSGSTPGSATKDRLSGRTSGCPPFLPVSRRAKEKPGRALRPGWSRMKRELLSLNSRATGLAALVRAPTGAALAFAGLALALLVLSRFVLVLVSIQVLAPAGALLLLLAAFRVLAIHQSLLYGANRSTHL